MGRGSQRLYIDAGVNIDAGVSKVYFHRALALAAVLALGDAVCPNHVDEADEGHTDRDGGEAQENVDCTFFRVFCSQRWQCCISLGLLCHIFVCFKSIDAVCS